jgi:hypothetical protein
MHFHLPGPLHGWREFAGEVGIIVLGVLIVLQQLNAIHVTADPRVLAALGSPRELCSPFGT